MFQVTQYASAKEPKVQNQINLTEVLNIIKNGDSKLPLIQFARTLKKGSPEYDTFKKNMLPTFRFNFLVADTATNTNITAPTGLIYLDADNVQEIPDSSYVLAKWKSLSATGFGILVKVNGLTLDNYKDTYDHLSELIEINSDAGARKATQQTILSYDPKLYYNTDAIVYECQESKKVSSPTKEKKEKCIVRDETFYNRDEKKIRFNNIDEYFKGEYTNEDYRVFNEKIMICSPFIPHYIEEGKRNSTLFFLLTQFALLNPNTGAAWLKAIADSINKKMHPNLPQNEIRLVIHSVIKKREEGSLELYFNEERRILFNPESLLTRKQKMDIVNKELGKLKSEKTQQLINIVIDDWDHNTHGKITQQKVARLADISIQTVKKHWKVFKSLAKWINNGKSIVTETEPQKYKSNDEIDLYNVLPAISFTVQESASIIFDINRGKVLMSELVQYIGKQRKEQQYNDYKGVTITTEHIGALKAIIAA